jgi:nicotinamide riboside transporter PnuC
MILGSSKVSISLNCAFLKKYHWDIHMLTTQVLTHSFAQPIDTSTRCNSSIEKVHDAAVRIESLVVVFSGTSGFFNLQVYRKNVRKFTALNIMSIIIILQQFLQLPCGE